jgi:hypothetical protein
MVLGRKYYVLGDTRVVRASCPYTARITFHVQLDRTCSVWHDYINKRSYTKELCYYIHTIKPTHLYEELCLSSSSSSGWAGAAAWRCTWWQSSCSLRSSHRLRSVSILHHHAFFMRHHHAYCLVNLYIYATASGFKKPCHLKHETQWRRFLCSFFGGLSSLRMFGCSCLGLIIISRFVLVILAAPPAAIFCHILLGSFFYKI